MTTLESSAAMLSVPRLGRGRIAIFAFGDFAFNLYWQSITLFLLFYYTDVVGLSPAVAGLIYMVASFWDGAIDPLIGAAADRTRTRWGGYRPYLLFGAPILGLSFALLYFRPPLAGGALVAFVLIAHLVFRTCYASVNVPYSALSARITASGTERSEISGFRMIFATLASALVPLVTQPIAKLAGGPNGFFLAAGLFALVATAILPIVFFTTREHLPPVSAEPSLSTGRFWASVAKNQAFWSLIAGSACMIVCSTVISKSVLYYFKYALGQEAAARTALALMGLSGVLIVPGWMVAARFIGKRGVWYSGCAVGLVGLAALGLSATHSVVATDAILICIHVGALGLAFSYWSMLPDCVEYGEWRTGVRAEAFIFGLGGMFAKISVGLGAGLFGLVLGRIGYHANQAQTELTLAGLKATMVGLPAAGFILGALALTLSPMKKGAHEAILKALAKQQQSGWSEARR